MDKILEFIKGAFRFIRNLVVKIINGCINFFKNVVGWFKNLNLKQSRDIPFVADANKHQIKVLLSKAPVKNVGIFNGVYNQDTDEITHHEYIEADAVDMQTRNVLGNEELVVLA